MNKRVHLDTVLKSGESTEIPQCLANPAFWIRTVSRCTLNKLDAIPQPTDRAGEHSENQLAAPAIFLP